MCKPNHLPMMICLLGSWLLCGAVGAAGDPVAGQILGLCCGDEAKDMVLEEVLRTEGVPYARLHDLNQLDKSDLKGLILGEGFDDSSGEVTRFLERGGVVLSLKPSGHLADVLGLKQVGAQNDGYLTVRGKGAELVSYQGRLQLFGQSSRYQGGENLASLSPADGFGGIIRVKRGPGTAIAVAFDLAKTLLTILQPKSECGKAVDTSKVEYDLGDVPQVDLMRRLLVGLFLDAIDVPIARKWYFPSQRKAMLVVVGDQDGADFAQLKVVLAMIKELGTPYTLCVTPADQPMTKEQFTILAEGGMDFALHPDFVSPGRKFTQQEFDAQAKKAAADVGCAMIGQRTHGCRWESFREVPSWAEKAGLQYDAILGMKRWESKPPKDGYWVGTGLPYHFIDLEGSRRLDLLEIPIAGIDNNDFEKRRKYPVTYSAHKTFLIGLGHTEDEAFAVSKQGLDQAMEKYHTANGYCWHPIYLAAKKLRLPVKYSTDVHFRKCITYAKSRGIGLTGTNALNEFWRSREKVLFKAIAWNPESAIIQYRVSSEAKVSSLTFIVPQRFHERKAQISINGHLTNYTQANLFGGQYAMFAVDVGAEELLVTARYDD